MPESARLAVYDRRIVMTSASPSVGDLAMPMDRLDATADGVRRRRPGGLRTRLDSRRAETACSGDSPARASGKPPARRGVPPGAALLALVFIGRTNALEIVLVDGHPERAQRLLDSDRELSLAEVAARSGFSEQSHFTHLFKREVGVAPGQFRLSARIAQKTASGSKNAVGAPCSIES